MEAIRDEAELKLALGERLAQHYLDGKVDLAQRAHVLALVWCFLWDPFRATRDWAEWAIAEVGRWPHTPPTGANLARAPRIFQSAPGGRAGRQSTKKSGMKFDVPGVTL